MADSYTIKVETSFTEFRKHMKVTSELEFFEDKTPVVFYSGEEKNLFIAEVDKYRIDIWEQSVFIARNVISMGDVEKNIDKYIKECNIVTKIVLLMDRMTSEVLYDFTNQWMVDYNCFSSLPPKGVYVDTIFWWEDDKNATAHVIQFDGPYGNDTALYVMYFSQFLFAGKIVPTGLDLVGTLFTDYYAMDSLNDSQQRKVIDPKRKESRYGGTQLQMLDSFHHQLQTKKANDEKIQKAIQESNRKIASQDEVDFSGHQVPLSWIRDHKRLPLLDGTHYIRNDLEFYSKLIQFMYVENDKFYYKCFANVAGVDETYISSYLGISLSDVVRVFNRDKTVVVQ